MKRIARVCCAVAPLALISLVVAAQDKPEEPPKTQAAQKRVASRTTLEKEFAESLSGATLVGYFTTNGQEEKGLKEEKYKLKSVKKLPNGEMWLFEYQHGDKGVTIPLPLEVKWAGDTPMITLTDVTIPGVGTFTARVLFYRGEYAGTWAASDHGGKLFGKIVKEDAEEDEKEEGEDEDADEEDR